MLLSKSIKIKSLEIANRIVQAPLYLGHDGLSREFADFYIERAKGGCGLLIVPQSSNNVLNDWLNPEYVSAWKPLIDAVHKAGAKIILQFFEAVEDINSFDFSAWPMQYAFAASKIEEAGFDGVQIHGGHFTPFASLLSPRQNKRSDAYGQDRARALVDVVSAVRQSVSDDFPVLCRISGSDLTEDAAEKGFHIHAAAALAKRLEQAGLDCIDVSAGTADSPDDNNSWPGPGKPEGVFTPFAAEIKKAVNIPVIGVGRIASGTAAEAALEKGYCDMIAVGRSLIADPEWANKILEGRQKDVIACRFCNKGCLTETLFIGIPVDCARW